MNINKQNGSWDGYIILIEFIQQSIFVFYETGFLRQIVKNVVDEQQRYSN